MPFFEITITIASGFLFEIFGRRYVLYYSSLLGALSLIFFPIMAPFKSLYILASVLWTASIQSVLYNPLILDYACKESRGLAISYSVMATSLGVCCSLLIVQWLKKDFDPINSWGIMSIFMIAFAFMELHIVEEPKQTL